MHSRCIKCFCGGGKTLLFKGKREAGNAPTATFQRDAASAAHRTSPCVATDVCCARSDVVRPLDARKTHQVFLRGRKNDVVQRGKREPPVWSKAHSARPMRCGFSREPARYNHRTRSTPRRTAHLNLCVCCELHARDPRKRAMPETYNPAPKIKAFGRIRAPREQFQ